MPTMINIQEAKAKRTCAYCGGGIAKGERLLRVSLNLWNKNGSSTGGANLCGRCLTQLTLELNELDPLWSGPNAPLGLPSEAEL